MRTSSVFKAIYAELRFDVDDIFKPADGLDGKYHYADPILLTQSKRRHAVKAIASFVEATSFQVRNFILDHSPVGIDESLILALQDKQIDITPSGDLRLKKLKTGTIAQLRFTFNLFSQLFNIELFELFSGNELNRMIEFFSIRDRLMHPKTQECIYVSDDEIRKALFVYGEYDKALVKVLAEIINNLEKFIMDFKSK